MRETDVVEPTNTDGVSPVSFALNNDGSLRFCIDYLRLNAITIQDAFPIPGMDACLHSLCGATIISTLY